MESNSSLFKLFLSEFIGTGLLLAIGLSLVIIDFGKGSAIAALIPSIPVRRLLTGFLFGCTGCAITLSPVGKISGAHLNPALSVAFWMRGKMNNFAVAGYTISQLLGAVAGSLPLLLWGNRGNSIHYANTVPGIGGLSAAFLGEMLTTAGLVTVVFVFVGSQSLRRYTPFTMPFLYCFMVWAEAAYSGCSTNPARSLGPAVISGVYAGYWLYILAPLVGAVLVVGLFRGFRLHHYYRIEAARLSYHEEPSPQG